MTSRTWSTVWLILVLISAPVTGTPFGTTLSHLNVTALIAAAPERVPLAWCPYIAALLLLATAALTSYLGSRPRPGGKAWENR